MSEKRSFESSSSNNNEQQSNTAAPRAPPLKKRFTTSFNQQSSAILPISANAPNLVLNTSSSVDLPPALKTKESDLLVMLFLQLNFPRS
jgi:hypothetical protein